MPIADDLKVLDLYCGLGAASDGYAKCGFTPTGVDWNPQPRYPYTFVIADVWDLFAYGVNWAEFDLIHASPPCQGYVDGHPRGWLYDSAYDIGGKYERQIERLREILLLSGKPYVIENVDTAPLDPARSILLCGTWFKGLKVQRHRVFETNWGLENLVDVGYMCICGDEETRIGGSGGYVTLAGGSGRSVGDGTWGSSALVAQDALGINRGTYSELKECVPPAYTEFIGRMFVNSR